MSNRTRSSGAPNISPDNAEGNVRDYWDGLGGSAGDAAAIDPNDALGYKNAYVALVRDIAIDTAISDLPEQGRLMDFGCGTGTFLSNLRVFRPHLMAFGIDVSKVMLSRAVKRDGALRGRLIRYDGIRLPLADESLDAITTGGALLYLRDDQCFLAVCREFKRVLRTRGIVVAVEQVRASAMYDSKSLKVQRTAEGLRRLFEMAGFECIEWRQIRRGRFPLTYAIRFGFVPKRLHRAVARIESFLWKNAAMPRHDYADAVFKFRRIELSR